MARSSTANAVLSGSNPPDAFQKSCIYKIGDLWHLTTFIQIEKTTEDLTVGVGRLILHTGIMVVVLIANLIDNILI